MNNESKNINNINNQNQYNKKDTYHIKQTQAL